MSQYLGWKVPSTTPGSKADYQKIESNWLKYIDSLNVNPAEFDLAIWKMYANRDDSDYKRLVPISSNASLAVVS